MFKNIKAHILQYVLTNIRDMVDTVTHADADNDQGH